MFELRLVVCIESIRRYFWMRSNTRRLICHNGRNACFRNNPSRASHTRPKKYLQKHENGILNLSPLQLERLLGDILSDFFDCELKWTGRGADGGFDLFGIINEQLTLIQVKRRTTQKAESVVPIRELLGAMVVNGASRGIFVSTAPKFSSNAHDEVVSRNLEELGLKIELINYTTLQDIIRQTTERKNEYPWSSEFDEQDA